MNPDKRNKNYMICKILRFELRKFLYYFYSYDHPSFYTVRIGTNKRTGYDLNAVELNVKQIVMHPYYSTYVFGSYDIALLRVDGKIEMNDYARTVCLPHPSKVFQSSDECYTTGWGRVSK